MKAATMSTRLREHLHKNVYGIVAVFVAIGGTAYAVDGPNPGQNTIGSEDIIGNEVKSDDIGNGRIFNLDIADDIIQGAKIKNGTVTGDDVDESALSLPGQVIPIDNFVNGNVNLTGGAGNVFLHPPATVTLAGARPLTGTISTTMKSPAGNFDIEYGLCYSPGPGTNFMFPSHHKGTTWASGFTDFTASASTTFPFVGTIEVGLCARNPAASGTITVNVGYVSGWLLATKP